MDFKKPLSPGNKAMQWESLLMTIQNIQINELRNKVKLTLEKSGRYTTKSMYRQMLHREGCDQADKTSMEMQGTDKN
jgi:hypothetical protein